MKVVIEQTTLDCLAAKIKELESKLAACENKSFYSSREISTIKVQNKVKKVTTVCNA